MTWYTCWQANSLHWKCEGDFGTAEEADLWSRKNVSKDTQSLLLEIKLGYLYPNSMTKYILLHQINSFTSIKVEHHKDEE